ncbi:GNAT family N-acetyltransferase [Nocardioides fonticola]|uniref:GNAT family N-acetyltransferase n=1 Tax=Nocardioides fonticola TaxID=450363 RepID=A0ABP7XBB0_9ACTN
MADRVLIRRGSPDDAPALRVLAEAVVPATYDPIDPDFAVHTLETWWDVDRMRVSLAQLWHGVAELDDRIVGVANLGRSDDRWVMWKLYVHPDAQGRSIGRRLLEAALEQVPAGEALWLEHVDGNDRAHAFYKALGFETSHREPQERFPDLIWMKRDH